MSKIVVHRVLFYSIVQHKVCFLFRIIKWKTLTSRSCFLIKHVPSRNTWEAGEVGFLAWLQDWEWLRGTDWIFLRDRGTGGSEGCSSRVGLCAWMRFFCAVFARNWSSVPELYSPVCKDKDLLEQVQRRPQWCGGVWSSSVMRRDCGRRVCLVWRRLGGDSINP